MQTNNKASRPLELLHTDLCEISPLSIEGHIYFMVAYDDNSRMIFAFLFKRKSETAETLQDFITYVQNQTLKTVIAIRSDNEKEYVNKRLQKFFKEKEVNHQLTEPDNSQSNGRAERVNRILQEKAKCMLIDFNVKKKFWSEAISTAAKIISLRKNTL